MTHEPMVGRVVPRNKSLRLGVLRPGSIRPEATIATTAFGIFLLATSWPARAGQEPEPELGRLRRHVEVLASAEFGGRSGEASEKSRAYLVEEFRSLKLQPLFHGSFTQDIPAREPGRLLGRNVGAKLEGSDPLLKDQWLIVAAHFDHLGVRDGVLFPGADDNATAVAMMLEVARCVVQSPVRPRRSVMFVGFDLEEVGLFGSRYLVEHMPVPLEKVVLFITADMIGRSLGGVGEDRVFVMGTERLPSSRSWLRDAAAGKPLRLGLIGADILLLDRSDYGPFRSRQVPFLFFSTGENPCYHSPRDTPDTIDYPKFEAISRVIGSVARRALRDDARPAWSAVPDHGMDEANALRDTFHLLKAHRDELKIGQTAGFLLEKSIGMLDGIASRGAITPTERAGLIRMAQVIMAATF